MSTISSVIFRDSDILPVSRWIHRKRRHYKQAIDQYSSQLCELLETDTKRRLAELGSRSVDIRIDNKLLPLRGITIDRSILPNAEPGELVELINLASEQSLTRGRVLSVSPSKVRIKLDKPLVKKAQTATPDNVAAAAAVAATAGGGHKEEEEEDTKQENKQQVDQKQAVTTTEQPHDEEPAAGATNGSEQQDAGLAEDKDKVNDNNQKEQPAPLDAGKLDVRIKFEMRGVLSRHDCVAYALHKFQKLSCSLPIHQCLLGIYNDHSDTLYEKTRVMSFPGRLPELRDRMQRLAVEQAMRRRIALVEGPAGSGKTLVAVYAACNMVRLKKRKVLLCSPVQANVGRLAKMVAQIEGINVVELPSARGGGGGGGSSKAKPKSTPAMNGQMRKDTKLANSSKPLPPQRQQSTDDQCNLDKLVDDEIYWMAWNRSKDFFHGHVDLIHNHATRVVEGRTSHLRRRYEQKVLAKADIVCCSLLQTSDSVLEGINFDMLIIDDVQVSKEIDCIVPIMTKGVKQVLLLSDLRRDIRRFHGRAGPPSMPSKSAGSASSSVMANDDSGDRISLANSNCDSTNSARDFSDTNSVQGSSASSIMTTTTTRTRTTTSTTTTTNSRRHASTSSRRTTLGANYNAIEPSNQPGGLFERWLSIGISAVVLKKQYRAHESLSLFTNHQFYRRPPQNDQENNQKLTTIIRDTFKRVDSWSWLPNNRCLTAIFDRGTSGATLSQEVKLQVDKLTNSENIDKTRIGVIINTQLDSLELPEDVDCGTVSDFVGQEKDFIILAGICRQQPPGTNASNAGENHLVDVHSTSSASSATPSSPLPPIRRILGENERSDDNFLHDDNALNVALTRARLGLFIVTDLKHFTKHPLEAVAGDAGGDAGDAGSEFCKSWRELVNYYLDNNLVS